MSIVDYFEKPSVENLVFPFIPVTQTLGSRLVDEAYDVAIIGVKADSDQVNRGSAAAPDEIRKYLYALRGEMRQLRIADLGNLKVCDNPTELYFALRGAVSELRAIGVLPVILGGSQELTAAVYDGLKEISQELNLSVLDSRIDLSIEEGAPISPSAYLNTIINDDKRFRVDVIGCQSYYCSQLQVDKLEENNCWVMRLGNLRADLAEAEPIFRDSDFVSLDMSVVRQSDAPGHEMPSPNGLTGEELCQLTRYAGLSDRIQAFGLFEVNPYFDNNGQTASLAAQLVWHFLEAYANRYGDYPLRDLSSYKTIVVPEMDGDDDIVFYNNHLNNRWWVQIPMRGGDRIFSCSYNDYSKVVDGRLFDLWMRYYQR